MWSSSSAFPSRSWACEGLKTIAEAARKEQRLSSKDINRLVAHSRGQVPVASLPASTLLPLMEAIWERRQQDLSDSDEGEGKESRNQTILQGAHVVPGQHCSRPTRSGATSLRKVSDSSGSHPFQGPTQPGRMATQARGVGTQQG